MVPRNNSAGLVFFIFHLKLHYVANMRVGRLKPRQPKKSRLTPFFFNKNKLNKNTEAEIAQKNKNKLRTD